MLTIGSLARLRVNGYIGKVKAVQINNIDKDEVERVRLCFEDTGVTAWYEMKDVQEI